MNTARPAIGCVIVGLAIALLWLGGNIFWGVNAYRQEKVNAQKEAELSANLKSVEGAANSVLMVTSTGSYSSTPQGIVINYRFARVLDRGLRRHTVNSTALMFPLLPNKREQLFEFAKALSGERAQEYATSQESVLKESWYLQSTPMGDFLIVYFEAPDPAGVFASLAQSTTPFDTWFRQQAQEISGIDFSQPFGDLSHPVFKYERT